MLVFDGIVGFITSKSQKITFFSKLKKMAFDCPLGIVNFCNQPTMRLSLEVDGKDSNFDPYNIQF